MRRWRSMHAWHPSRCADAGFGYPVRALGVAVAATRPPVPHWAAPTWRGATPQSEGLVRARTQVCFHTPAPVPWGRSHPSIPGGKAVERRCERGGSSTSRCGALFTPSSHGGYP